MVQSAVETMEKRDVPPMKFWEDDLEMGVNYILSRVGQNGHFGEWVNQLNGRQAEILCRNLAITEAESLADKKDILRGLADDLPGYFLADQFGKYKSKISIVNFAKGVLAEGIFDTCRINEEDFDTTALLFAIYHRNWSDLKLIFHWVQFF